MDTIDEAIGTGRTTKQIIDAPHGAIYIWPVYGSRCYFEDLAIHLGRGDLIVKFPSCLDYLPSSFDGRNLTGIVVDHGCKLTERQWDNLAIIERRVKVS